MAFGWIGPYTLAHRLYDGGVAGRNLAADAAAAEQNTYSAVFMLEEQMARQALLIKSLLVLCERKGLFDEPEFRALVDEIDLSDGKLDGRYTPPKSVPACANCGRNSGKGRATCMYCGTPVENRELL